MPAIYTLNKMDGDEQGEGREGEDKRRSTRKGSDLLQIPTQKVTLYSVSLDSGSEESQYTNQLRPSVSSLLEIRKWHVNNISLCVLSRKRIRNIHVL